MFKHFHIWKLNELCLSFWFLPSMLSDAHKEKQRFKCQREIHLDVPSPPHLGVALFSDHRILKISNWRTLVSSADTL